jgi:hypothetical protein
LVVPVAACSLLGSQRTAQKATKRVDFEQQLEYGEVAAGKKVVRYVKALPVGACELGQRADFFWAVDRPVHELIAVGDQLRKDPTAFGARLPEAELNALFDSFDLALRLAHTNLEAIKACGWPLQTLQAEPGYWTESEQGARDRHAAAIDDLITQSPKVRREHAAKAAQHRAEDANEGAHARFEDELVAALADFPARCGMKAGVAMGVVVVERESTNTAVFWEKSHPDGSTFILRCDGSVTKRLASGGQMTEAPKLLTKFEEDLEKLDAEEAPRIAESKFRACVDRCTGSHPFCEGTERFPVVEKQKIKRKRCESACEAECKNTP